MKAILVTGSRDWKQLSAVRHVLDEIDGRRVGVIVLIHGACRGADAEAGQYGKELGWSVVSMPAQWMQNYTYCSWAGSDRNARMVEVLKNLRAVGYGCEVHAFPLPSSKGTRHMMRLAEEAGFTVRNHGELNDD
jgi:hypothetical protein